MEPGDFVTKSALITMKPPWENNLAWPRNQQKTGSRQLNLAHSYKKYKRGIKL